MIMKNKINIAELLKDCPRGMELDCTMYENLYFDYISNSEYSKIYPIHCYTEDDMKAKYPITFTLYGRPSQHDSAKCVIFPKGKTTWEDFVPPCEFKDGDVVVSTLGSIAIANIKHPYIGYCETYCSRHQNTICEGVTIIPTRLATEKEKQKLFQAIKDNGYKWNPETKTLKKLAEPKFKKGDIIQDKDGYKVRITNVSIEDECYGYESLTVNGIGGISFNRQDKWELVPNKFDITTLVPFESRVLVRHNKDNKWCGSFFSHIDGDFHSHCYKFVTIAGKSYPMMIPYEENQHLLGTTNDCDEYYKIW